MYCNLSFFIVYGCIFILILSVLFLNIESLLVCVTVEDLLLEYCETKFSLMETKMIADLLRKVSDDEEKLGILVQTCACKEVDKNLKVFDGH